MFLGEEYKVSLVQLQDSTFFRLLQCVPVLYSAKSNKGVLCDLAKSQFWGAKFAFGLLRGFDLIGQVCRQREVKKDEAVAGVHFLSLFEQLVAFRQCQGNFFLHANDCVHKIQILGQ